MSKRRLVLMGAGMIGREHATLIAGHPAAELVGIADPTPEARAYAAEINVRHFDDYGRMLDDIKPGITLLGKSKR